MFDILLFLVFTGLLGGLIWGLKISDIKELGKDEQWK